MTSPQRLWLAFAALIALVGGAVLWLDSVSEPEPLPVEGTGLVKPVAATGRETALPPAAVTTKTETDTPPEPLTVEPGLDPMWVEESSATHGPPPSRAVTFVGRIVDRNGNPIRGARVHHLAARQLATTLGLDLDDEDFEIPWDSLASTVTDGSGHFRLPAIDLVARADSDVGNGQPSPLRFAPAEVPRLVIVHPEYSVQVHVCDEYGGLDYDAGDVVVRLGPIVTGQVVSVHGRGISGAKVAIRSPPAARAGITSDNSWSIARRALEVKTDGEGRFELRGLWLGTHELLVSHRRYLPTAVELHVPTDERVVLEPFSLVRPGRLEGMVKGLRGEPVEGAAVIARPARFRFADLTDAQLLAELNVSDEREVSGESRTLTDADGYFQMETLGAEQYSVFADAAGFSIAVQRDVPQRSAGLEFALQPQRSMLVSVSSALSGEPVRAARAEAHRLYGARLQVLSGGAAMRAAGLGGNPDGMLWIPRVGERKREWETQLVVSAPGFATTPFCLPPALNPGRNEESVVIGREASVTGRITRDGGVSVAGATVRLSYVPTGAEKDTLPPTPAVSAVSNKRGLYKLDSLRAGDWELHVTRKGCLPWESRKFSLGAAEARTGEDVELSRGAIILGEVLWPDGRPAPLRLVRAVRQDVPPELFFATSGETDLAGRFVLNGLPPGTYRVVSHPGAEALIGADFESAHVSLQLQQPPIVTGRVLSGRVGLQGALVTAATRSSGSEDDYSITQVATDGEGAYRIEMPWEGVCWLSAQHLGVMNGSVIVTPKWGEVVEADLVLPNGRVTVRVVDAASGAPIPGAEVILGPDHRGSSQQAREKAAVFGRIGRTDAEGRFPFEHLEIGESYRVDALSPSHRPGVKRGVYLGPRTNAIEVGLALEPGAALSGRVWAEGGKPLPSDLSVRVTPMLASNQTYREAVVDANGDFQIRNLEPGRVFVRLGRSFVDLMSGTKWNQLLVSGTTLSLDEPAVLMLKLPR
jgi:protocatechuate 3,4-dioxygenase beta subunit